MILPEMLLSPGGGTVGLCSGLILILHVSVNSEGGFGGVWIPIFSSCCDILAIDTFVTAAQNDCSRRRIILAIVHWVGSALKLSSVSTAKMSFFHF